MRQKYVEERRGSTADLCGEVREIKSVILIVDDDPDIVAICRRYLADRGHGVLWAANGREALDVLAAHKPDVILLDVMLPDIDGFELAKHIHGISGAAIVFMTGRDDPEERARGLNLGSEYVVKPFDLEELGLRLAMLEQRNGRVRKTAISLPPLELDCIRKQVCLEGRLVLLSESEFLLLEMLAETPGVPVSYERLSELLWPGVSPPRLHNLMNHVSSIRYKLCSNSDGRVRLSGRRGFGYMLECGDPPEGDGEK